MASWKEVSVEKYKDTSTGYICREIVNAGYINRGEYLYVTYTGIFNINESEKKIYLIKFKDENKDITHLEKDHEDYNSAQRSRNRMIKALKIHLGWENPPIDKRHKKWIFKSGQDIRIMEGIFSGKRIRSVREYGGIQYTPRPGMVVEYTPEKEKLVWKLEELERDYKKNKEILENKLFNKE